QHRQQQTPRARAEIEDTEWRSAIRKFRQNAFDECFSLRPRYEDARTNIELETPESLCAGEIGNRSARETTCDPWLKKSHPIPPPPLGKGAGVGGSRLRRRRGPLT